jgi:hypothetical protein
MQNNQELEKKDVAEVDDSKVANTQQAVLKEDVAPTKKAALSMDDAEDVINPIIPVTPDEFNKCVYVVLESRPEIKLVGKDNDKPAVIFKFWDKVKDGRANVNMFLPTPLADQMNDTDVKNAKRNFGSLKHVFGALIPTGTAGIDGETYHEVIQKCIDLIPETSINNPELKLNVKLVYNKQGYLGFPNFPPFISSKFKNMDFKLDPTYDLLTPPVKKAAGSGSTEEKADMAKYNEM